MVNSDLRIFKDLDGNNVVINALHISSIEEIEKENKEQELPSIEISLSNGKSFKVQGTVVTIFTFIKSKTYNSYEDYYNYLD